MNVIESERLKLRRFTLADLNHMIELESDPDIMKFTPSRVPLSHEKIEQRLKNQIENQTNNSPLGIWAVEFKQTGEFVGWCMLMERDHKYPELGFIIVKSHWKKGIATETGKLLIDYGFNTLKLEGMTATTDQNNFISKKVLKKLGFKFFKTIEVYDKVFNHLSRLDVFELHANELHQTDDSSKAPRKKVINDFLMTLILPLTINKFLMMYFGLNYSEFPGEGFGYGLVATFLFMIFMISRFLWKYRHVSDP